LKQLLTADATNAVDGHVENGNILNLISGTVTMSREGVNTRD
jgi:hypothetical protein